MENQIIGLGNMDWLGVLSSQCGETVATIRSSKIHGSVIIEGQVIWRGPINSEDIQSSIGDFKNSKRSFIIVGTLGLIRQFGRNVCNILQWAKETR